MDTRAPRLRVEQREDCDTAEDIATDSVTRLTLWVACIRCTRIEKGELESA